MRCMEQYLELPTKQVLEIMQKCIISNTKYFGIQTLKNPIDFWIYQEIIFETQPDVKLEIGNLCGGSTLALAHFCDCLGKGRVLGIDTSHQFIPEIVKNIRE